MVGVDLEDTLGSAPEEIVRPNEPLDVRVQPALGDDQADR